MVVDLSIFFESFLKIIAKKFGRNNKTFVSLYRETNQLKFNIMTIEFFTETKNEINTRIDALTAELNSFPKNASGMVNPTTEYRAVRTRFDIAFKELQTINKFASKELKKQYRDNARAARFNNN